MWKQQALHSAAPFIEKANAEWTHAIAIGDADTLSAPYDEQGIFIRPDGAEIRGKSGVRDMYAKRRGDVQVLKADIKSEGRAAADHDDVYEWGTATMTMKRSGKVQRGNGSLTDSLASPRRKVADHSQHRILTKPSGFVRAFLKLNSGGWRNASKISSAQKAAGAALSAKRGDTPKSKLKGASNRWPPR